jgi:transporter family protein
MDWTTFSLVAITIATWGGAHFLDKLATGSIGTRAAFWHELAFASVVFVYSLQVHRLRGLLSAARDGMGIATFAGAIAAVGWLAFAVLLTRMEASVVVPLTALYPALTSVLAIALLHEDASPKKLLGIGLSLVAVYLLGT